MIAKNQKLSASTLYDKITALGLERKLINITLAKARIPASMQDDAAQEIRIAWLNAMPDPDLSEGQTASYAHTIGFHAALRHRRDMGSPVRLPGSAFRKKKDGTTYVQPGHLAAPISWEDLADVLDNQDGGVDAEEPSDLSRLTPVEMLELEQQLHGAMTLRENISKQIAIECEKDEVELRKKLSRRQLRILVLLKSGKSLDEVEDMLGVQPTTLQRNIKAIRDAIEALR